MATYAEERERDRQAQIRAGVPQPQARTLAPSTRDPREAQALQRAAAAPSRPSAMRSAQTPGGQTPPPRQSSMDPGSTQVVQQGNVGLPDLSKAPLISRAVPGAPGVVRYDRTGESPLYSNVGEAPIRGGTVSTFDGSALRRYAEQQRSPVSMLQRQLEQFDRETASQEAGRRGSRYGLLFRDRAREAQRGQLTGMLASALQGQQQGELAEREFERGAPMREAEIGLRQAQARAAQLGTQPQMREAPGYDREVIQGYQELVRQEVPGAAEALNDYLQRTKEGSNKQREMEVRLNTIMNQFPNATLEDLMSNPEFAQLYSQLYAPRLPMQTFADGGLVSAVRGAGYGQTPDAQAVLPEINEYREYAMGAQALGLPAIPFEQFLTMREGARQVGQAGQPQRPMGFADGGLVSRIHPSIPERQPMQPRPDETIPERPYMQPQPRAAEVPLGTGSLERARGSLLGINQRMEQRERSALGYANGGVVDPTDVSGKMVFDPDPNAPIDSIPAMIDGETPAALDSGEFVIPHDVVMFHGVDKLNKLIAQARQE